MVVLPEPDGAENISSLPVMICVVSCLMLVVGCQLSVVGCRLSVACLVSVAFSATMTRSVVGCEVQLSNPAC